MELYQIRYFLAVAKTLNFTRAAEDCNVSQPALTKAIQKLEEEFGGPLFRREGRRSHITELGKSVLPMLTQCYQSATAAKGLAKSLEKGDVAILKIGISASIPPGLLEHPVSEIRKHFQGIEIDLVRAPNEDLLGFLEDGEIELGFVLESDSYWERLNIWNLFEDEAGLAVPETSGLAGLASLRLQDIENWPLLVRAHCVITKALLGIMDEKGLKPKTLHKVSSQVDLPVMAKGTESVVVLSPSEAFPGHVLKKVDDLDLKKKINLVAVSGRQYSKAGATFIHLVRAMDWTRFNHAP